MSVAINLIVSFTGPTRNKALSALVKNFSVSHDYIPAFITRNALVQSVAGSNSVHIGVLEKPQDGSALGSFTYAASGNVVSPREVEAMAQRTDGFVFATPVLSDKNPGVRVVQTQGESVSGTGTNPLNKSYDALVAA